MDSYARLRFLPAYCVAVSFALAVAAVVARGDGPLAKGTLSGTVVDVDDRPVAGARVKLLAYDASVPGTQLRTRSDATSSADGRFQLGPIEAEYHHRFHVRVEAEGLAAGYVAGDTFLIFPGVDNSLGKIRLEHGHVLRGVVLDEDGSPRAGATVDCHVYHYELGHNSSDVTPRYSLTTDSQGRYETPRLPTGQFWVSTQPPERQLVYLNGPIGPDTPAMLEPLRLKKDVPVRGTLVDEQGQPLAGIRVAANAAHTDLSDAQGHFVLRGFGETGSFQMQIWKDGYMLINWAVLISPRGLQWREVGLDKSELSEPAKKLTVAMKTKREAWIKGQVVDDATGKPVPIDKVVLCFFERKPIGEIVLNGCRDSGFEQPMPGTFRMSYSTPDEYHLTVSAAGYHDGEAFTRKVSRLEPIDGIVIRLKSKAVDPKPQIATRRISGTVTRNGVPVKNGWAALWGLRRPADIVNAYMMRGRTATPDSWTAASAPVRAGHYSLEAPYQDEQWYVVVEEPGQPITQVGPVAIGVNEDKRLDIACPAGGAIRGRVTGIPTAWRGQVWVVAFTDNGIRHETRVERDGNFALDPLPPGRYGLKAGSDAFLDSEVPRPKDWKDIPADAWKKLSDPWARAKTATVKAGETVEGIELQLPQK